MRIILLCVCVLIPQAVFASVYISEIAWMGDSESANNEWIELFSTESVSLDGWSLAAVDGTPSIPLSGTINGAFLLERGEGVLSSVADVVYVGALENGGEVLVLSDAEGNEIDRVDGSSSWKDVGGDNDSKETAQKESGVWNTAAPSPGVVQEESSEASESAAPSVSETSSGSSYIQPVLRISIPDRIEAVAGNETVFSVDVGNSEGAKYSGAVVTWNFGDGSFVQGNNMYHKYVYPGTYSVLVDVTYGRENVSKRIEVSVRDATVTFSRVNADAVEIVNEDKKEIDISRWRIVDGNNVFVFPEGTIVLGEKSLLLSHLISGFHFSNLVSLTYSNGELVTKKKVDTDPVVKYVPVSVEQEHVLEEVQEVAEVEESALPAAVLEATEEGGDVSIWIYVWIVLVLAVGGSIVYIRKYG